MREKPTFYSWTDTCTRITPASAGKTFIAFLKKVIKRDHPRECGKNKSEFVVVVAIVGSPPRVREKQDVNPETGEITGITPASAGKTRHPTLRSFGK